MSLAQAVLRIFEAFVVSSLIGIDREKTKRPAGLRTHVIVSLGACLVTIVPLMYYQTSAVGYDPLRMAAQVLSGIGFLGAGTILRYGENVTGLTTAASLWCSACLGISAGMGMHALTLITGALIMCILIVVPYMERKFLNKKTEFFISLSMRKDRNDLMLISDLLREKDINIKSVNIEVGESGNKVYKFYLSAKSLDIKESFLSEIYKVDLETLKEEDTFIND